MARRPHAPVRITRATCRYHFTSGATAEQKLLITPYHPRQHRQTAREPIRTPAPYHAASLPHCPSHPCSGSYGAVRAAELAASRFMRSLRRGTRTRISSHGASRCSFGAKIPFLRATSRDFRRALPTRADAWSKRGGDNASATRLRWKLGCRRRARARPGLGNTWAPGFLFIQVYCLTERRPSSLAKIRSRPARLVGRRSPASQR